MNFAVQKSVSPAFVCVRALLAVVILVVSFVFGAHGGEVTTATVAPTPEQVMQHHITGLIEGDAEMLMQDYAMDAVVVGEDRTYIGSTEIRILIDQLVAMNALVSGIEVSREMKADDVVIQRYILNRGTEQERSGEEVFVIRNGKIVFQAPQPSIIQ